MSEGSFMSDLVGEWSGGVGDGCVGENSCGLLGCGEWEREEGRRRIYICR